MAYAQGRVFLDADSHIMELPDFLSSNADAAFRDRVPRVDIEMGTKSSFGMEEAERLRAHPADKVAEMVALGDELISGPKGYFALGAFNGTERVQALDQLGFDRQLVFTTFSAPMAFGAKDIDVRYAAAAAHNRGVAEFCDADPRLMGVAALPLDDPARAMAEIDHILSLGLATVWVPHRPAGGRSPGHDDLDQVWAKLAEAGLPFVLHVGGQPLQIPTDWMNTGRGVPSDWQGGGENVRSKDMVALHHAAEMFIGAMVLDGVFERHPTLRGAVVELGAGWVPSFLKRLDWSAEIWRRSEPDLQKLERTPTEQVTAQMAFTPYVYEDIGDLIRISNDELYLFSSDYPHHEGGRNPLGRFERSLDGHTAISLDRFYADNFTRVFG
ncbi:MAG: amidohydrolase family protein [Actinomycetota bacterium]